MTKHLAYHLSVEQHKIRFIDVLYPDDHEKRHFYDKNVSKSVPVGNRVKWANKIKSLSNKF